MNFISTSLSLLLKAHHLYLYLHPPLALAPAQDWPIRRPVQVQEDEKDNEREKEEGLLYVLK